MKTKLKSVKLYSWILQLDIEGLTLSEKIILDVSVCKILAEKDFRYKGGNPYIYEFTGFPESTVKQSLTALCDKHHLLKRQKEYIEGQGTRHIYSVGENLEPYVKPFIDNGNNCTH